MDFIKEVLGDSWRTSLFGLGLIALGIFMAVAGGILNIWAVTKDVGAILIVQGGLAITTGIGFLLTRDHAASQRAAARLERDIQRTAVGTTQAAAAVAKDVASSVAADVAQQAVQQERRR